MRAVPPALLAAISGRTVKPTAFLDLWADKGLVVDLTSSSDWAQAVTQTNVDTARVPGSVVLAAGGAHPVAAASGWAQIGAETKPASINNPDPITYFWANVGPAWQVGLWVAERRYPFTASATILLDAVRLRFDAAASGGGGITDFEHHIEAFIVDAAGNQVGVSVRGTITESTATSHVLWLPRVTDLISGLRAALTRGANYVLVVREYYSAVGAAYAPSITLTQYAPPATDEPAAQWRILTPVAGRAFLAGGDEVFQPSGSITVQADVGQVPPNPGAIYFDDTRPAGTGISYQVRGSDDAVTWGAWTPAVSGDALPAHRYWQVQASLASNATNDETPQLNAVRIEYFAQAAKHTLGTTAAVSGGQQTAVRALEHVSALATQLSPKVPAVIEGGIRCTLAPHAETQAVMRTLTRGRRAVLRLGADGVADTLAVYSGAVGDVRYSAQRGYELELQDQFAIVGESVPSKRNPDWSSTTTYALGDRVSFGGRGYQSLTAGNTGNQPDASPTWWQDIGGVWSPADYSPQTNGGARWHLADIALDILRNHTSVRDDQIDIPSINAVKAALPNRTGNRIVTKPTKALTLLAELAWLLEAQWTVRAGKLALIPEPDPATATPVAQLTDDEIEEGLTYRYGWRDATNTGLLLTGYSGEGGGADKFSAGRVYVDAAALADHGETLYHQFEDRWGLDDTSGASDVEARITAYVTRWARGRAVVSCRASLRMMYLEPGDVVTVASAQLPPDRGILTAMVTRADLDWLGMRLNLTLLEV